MKTISIHCAFDEKQHRIYSAMPASHRQLSICSCCVASRGYSHSCLFDVAGKKRKRQRSQSRCQPPVLLAGDGGHQEAALRLSWVGMLLLVPLFISQAKSAEG